LTQNDAILFALFFPMNPVGRVRLQVYGFTSGPRANSSSLGSPFVVDRLNMRNKSDHLSVSLHSASVALLSRSSFFVLNRIHFVLVLGLGEIITVQKIHLPNSMI
jgi:hypothetical protein